MSIKHGKIQDSVSHLGDLEAVLILLALPNERGTAYLRQANFGNELAIANAGREQDGLINTIVPNAKGVPSCGAATAVRIKTRVAVPLSRGDVKLSPEDCGLEVAVLLEWGWELGCLKKTTASHIWTTAPYQAHKTGR